MNEEKTENPDAKTDIKIEWGEKGILGFVITGTAVAAFVGSNLYVMGLSITFHESVATYFDVLDYIQVTPAWAVPALVGSSVVFVLTAVCVLPALGAQFIVFKIQSWTLDKLITEPKAKENLREFLDKFIPLFLESFWRICPPFFLVLPFISLLFKPEASQPV